MQQSLQWQIKYLRAIMVMQAAWTMTHGPSHKSWKDLKVQLVREHWWWWRDFALLSLLLTERPTHPPTFLLRRQQFYDYDFPVLMFFVLQPNLWTPPCHIREPEDGRDHGEGFVRVGPRSYTHTHTQTHGPITRQHLEPHQLERFVRLVLSVLKMSSWRPNCRGVWRRDNEAYASQETLSMNNGKRMLRSTISIWWTGIWLGVKKKKYALGWRLLCRLVHEFLLLLKSFVRWRQNKGKSHV